MKLYARTWGEGTGLGINVLLTGQVQEDGGTIHRVEIYMPSGCDRIVGYEGERGGIEPLPRGRGAQQLLWVTPGDLTNDGSPLSQEALRAEVKLSREDKMRGPLGENWP